MLTRVRGIAAAIALLALSAMAPAAVTYTTHEGALNAAGQPISAMLEFTIHPDAIVVRVTNTTPNIQSIDQTISAISFSVYNKKAKGDLGFTWGQVRTVSDQGIKTAAEKTETKWTLTKSGSTYTLHAPGYGRGILPEPQGLTYDKADKSITDAGTREFLASPAVFQIQIPDISLTDDILGVKFFWGHEVGGGVGDLHIAGRTGSSDPSNTAVPDFGTPADVSLYPTPGSGSNNVVASGETGGLLGTVGGADYVPHGVTGGPPSVSPPDSSGRNRTPVYPTAGNPPTPGLIPPIDGTPNPPLPPTGGLIPPSGGTPNAPLPVPEPTTLGLLTLGAAGALWSRRKMRR